MTRQYETRVWCHPAGSLYPSQSSRQALTHIVCKGIPFAVGAVAHMTHNLTIYETHQNQLLTVYSYSWQHLEVVCRDVGSIYCVGTFVGPETKGLVRVHRSPCLELSAQTYWMCSGVCSL